MSAPSNIANVYIGDLVQQAIREGLYFPRDPATPNDVQIRLHRSASADGHRLAAALRERRDEVNRFFKVRRPAWPVVPDDRYGPRLDPDEPDAAIFLIQLEAILAEDTIATAIEKAVSHVEGRIAGIVARAVTNRRAAVSSSPLRPTAITAHRPAGRHSFRGGGRRD